MNRALLSFLLLLLVGGMTSLPVHAQVERPSDAFYVKGAVGISDYLGDATGTCCFADAFHTDHFNEDTFPLAALGEIGYQTSPSFGIGVGYQYGQYPLADNRESEFSGSVGTTRHVLQILGRYTIKAEQWTVSPYLDGGANVSFGGQSTGIGYSVGLGFDAAVSSRTSIFMEGRMNAVFDDQATDGIDGSHAGDALNPFPVIGLKLGLSSPTPPRVLSVDGPSSVQAGQSATYTASVNAEEANRPLSYQWQYGDGSSGSGLTSSHTYDEPGTYTVMFTASNEAGEASKSLTVEVAPRPEPPSIVSIGADPNPVDEGEAVRFSSNVQGDMPISYNWSFGDGTGTEGASPTYTYEEPGQYTARLEASNEAGENARTVTVRVNRALPDVCTTISEMSSAYFERNSSTLTEEAEESLQENADVLSKCPNLTVQVDGFAAPGERNPQSLSEDRAQAVADFYEENGVLEDRVEAGGQGQVEAVTTKKGEGRQYRRADSIPQRDEDGM